MGQIRTAREEMSTRSAAIELVRVNHWYGARQALFDVSFDVMPGELFALVGPNGGGKTTLFRLLATLLPLTEGSIHVDGHDIGREAHAVRQRLGVVFQSPSLDVKLTVAENLRFRGELYALAGAPLESRTRELLARFELDERRHERVETLSGGLQRRVELAAALLHRPRLLLLDEPSTGLDPRARSDFWRCLRELRAGEGVTFLLTTHLLDEAADADRVAILDSGRLVALDPPDQLRATVGGDTVSIESDDPARLAEGLAARFGVKPQIVDGQVRFEQPRAHEQIAPLVEAFASQIRSIRVSRPTLEDVFIARTGHAFDAV